MSQRNAVAVAVAVIGGALILTGCTGGASGAGWATPELPDQLPPVNTSTTLPLDAYKLSVDDRTVMQQGNVALLTACASEYGVAVEFSGDYLRPADDSRTKWGGLFGTESLEHAAVYGYHPAPAGPWALSGGFYLKDSGNIQVLPTADGSDAQHMLEQEVIFGTQDPSGESLLPDLPKGGCWASTEAQINAPLASFIRDEADLNNLAVADDRVVAAQAVWSSCMKEAGYTFDAVDQAIGSFPIAQPSAEEVETAVADVKCTDSSGWARVLYAVLADYQRQAIARDPNKFEGALAAEQKRFESISALR